ncbi:MAG: glycosyltransferase N-terminal domain-containing protein [Bacteroidota bacterium]
MKLLLYDLFILCFEAGAWLLSPFNVKARQWLLGRVHWISKLQQQIEASRLHADDNPVVWMHASSLGEFEQGRPVIEALKQKFRNLKVVITFFSPSGYEVTSQYKGADVICYLPTDTPANAIRFIQMIKPSLVIWVKYEYWYHHLKTLNKKNIPVLLVSSIFREDMVFFKWYGSFHRQMLQFFRHFFIQNKDAAALLKTLLPGEKNIEKIVTVSGDTRFDRVIDIAENWIPVPPIEKWLAGSGKVLVAGSTWPQDEDQLVHFVKQNQDVKLILAPHQVEPDLLKDSISLFGNVVLFSDLLNDQPEIKDSNVLIINNVGLLSRIYKYATVCYVGGGFSGSGIHNVLEASVYGKPVIHGPEYERYQEAVELVEAGGSFAVENALDLEKQLNILLSDSIIYQNASMAAKNFVYSQKGSTSTIVDFIQANRLLTSAWNR